MESPFFSNNIYNGVEFHKPTIVRSFSDLSTEYSDKIFVGTDCLTTLNNQGTRFEQPYPQMAGIIQFIIANVRSELKVFLTVEVDHLLSESFTIETTKRGFEVLVAKNIVEPHFSVSKKDGLTISNVSLRQTSQEHDVCFNIKYQE